MWKGGRPGSTSRQQRPSLYRWSVTQEPGGSAQSGTVWEAVPQEAEMKISYQEDATWRSKHSKKQLLLFSTVYVISFESQNCVAQHIITPLHKQETEN